MPTIARAGAVGVIKDISAHDIPDAAWSDSLNIRFLDGDARLAFGYGEVYNSPSYAPQYVMPVYVGSARYWLYMTASKAFAVTSTAGAAVHTDITHATPHSGTVNAWTGVNFQGIPIMNVGDLAKKPMYWDLDTTHKYVDVTSWPATTYCKALRGWKNMLVAMNLSEGGTLLPYAILISHPADPGALPTSYDYTDATKDAVKLPIVEGEGVIVDGGQLKDSFIVYKEGSAHRIDYIGGAFIVSNKQVFGMSGLLNRNCWVEFGGQHLAVTSSDVVVHDGYQARSILDKRSRRDFFHSIDADHMGLVHAWKSPFFNEITIAYPAIGSTVCDKGLVYNYVDDTVAFCDLPNVNHGICGPVDDNLADSWSSDTDTWGSDLTAWNGPGNVPNNVRVMMASSDTKLFLLDSSASFNGTAPSAYLEKRGIGAGDDQHTKFVSGLRLRVDGNPGDTLTIKVGGHDTDPFADPTWDETQTHTIGTTVQCDFTVDRRYPAIRIESSDAFQWRLTSYDMDLDQGGEW